MNSGNVESIGIGQIIDEASHLMENSRYSEAANALERGLIIEPYNREILERLVICNLELKKPQSAIQVLDQITRAEPAALAAWADKGFLHLLLNENRQGIDALQISLELDPRRPRLWQLLGLAYMGEENWEEGLDAFDRTLLLDPNSSIAWYNRGVCLFFLEYFHDALASVEQAYTIDPELREFADEWVTILQDAIEDLSYAYEDYEEGSAE